MLKLARAYLIVLLAAMAGSAYAASPVNCEIQSAGWDWREYRCPLLADGKEKSLRFKADFSGVHDDTKASINLTLDAVPVTCIQGSKTNLFGEDGDSLECRLVVPVLAGGKQVLGVAIKFHHAQLVAAELSSH